MMGFDYARLRGKIYEVFGKQYAFAVAMKMTNTALSKKLNNQASWKATEMARACSLLGIPFADAPLYFFNPLSCENTTE